MQHVFGKKVVIALGGSILFPGTIDVAFIRRFRVFVKKFIRRGFRFVIVVGGGRLSRVYQDAAGRVAPVPDEDKDWIGIHATRLNAHLLRTVFRREADPVVIDACRKIKKLRHPVTFASGWRPGWSTDYIAVALAAEFGAKEAVIAGKPSHVYPVKHKSPLRTLAVSNGTGDKDLDKAHPYETLNWKTYRRLIPPKWKPGSHAPVDPVAARLAQKSGIAAIVINGKDLKNFGRLLNGADFRGTIMQ